MVVDPDIARTIGQSSLRIPFDLERPLAFLDLETTGLNPRQDRIVELALIRFAPDGEVLERARRFNPGIPIPAEASRVHGITDADVAGQPAFSQTARSLFELIDPCDLVGFNIRRFDLPVLIAEFRRAGIRFDARSRRTVDIQAIFHREERRDLTAAARFYLGQEHPDAHSALADTRTSAAVLLAQLERYGHLPRTLDGLHGYCDELAPFESELDRWFLEGETGLVFRRGKHRGRALADVAVHERDYLDWMLAAEDMDEEVLIVVRNAMSLPDPAQLPLLSEDEGPEPAAEPSTEEDGDAGGGRSAVQGLLDLGSGDYHP